MELKASETSSIRCPYCHEEIFENSIVVTCPDCKTVQHKACVLFSNKCATHACAASWTKIAGAMIEEAKQGKVKGRVFACPSCGAHREGADRPCHRCEWAPRGKHAWYPFAFGHDCPYCGVCSYETREITKDCADDPVIKILAETPEMRFFLRICDECGHVSIFRRTIS
ncbi:MAG: RING finger protein [Planctomycetota bacterium]|nr:RING finger protein [Planctomycetota bacterium]